MPDTNFSNQDVGPRRRRGHCALRRGRPTPQRQKHRTCYHPQLKGYAGNREELRLSVSIRVLKSAGGRN